ncbi:amino acid adenylation domain-containing protein [Pseudomonas sp. CBSPBW29]|uniref:amino acid adenylation domain-containing protein n=1 Tax=Pseudomonas TaxID=286 RepID=UPI0021ACFED6|nr:MULTISPECIES: amino acid adenylation domain-containing protein [unclassified Pseudomonas]UVH49003.1 amino acid adenylation domain-containing protein [Pseudomonas sp. CBS]WEL40487.1 amino acid adenylation domain-containing protein [Pseudomonas sp. CBSPBW29]WEL77653.1 amino acid adenylation domain-containing protein [Pseudomonas sp. CBSPAW29]
MRHLKIGLTGSSAALNEISEALAQFGHGLVRVQDIARVDLLIDDGSEEVPPGLTCTALMSLRVGMGTLTDCGLPTLQFRCYDHSRRLLATLDVADEACGNGQRWRQQAVSDLVEWVAQQVSGFSRDPGYFSQTAVASDDPEHGLQALASLSYLHRFNQTADAELWHQAQVPMIERLENSLQTFADRPALNMAGSVLSYRQLHRMSLAIQQRLGPLLRHHDTPPVIGVCLGKSPELYASILAVLAYGAVYLPLEPGHPLQRQQVMLETAGVAVLLDDGKHPLRDGFSALDVSTLDTAGNPQLMRQRPSMDAACMVLYTSGTTGQPKGVLLSQHNLAHFTAWFGGHVQLNEHSRVLQFSPLSFDSSLMDIFPSLMAGAELIVPSEDQRRDPQQLVELIRQQRITHAFLPPALLSILPLDEPLGLAHVITGGDVCEPCVIEQLAGQCRLHNFYGPTEATVLATHRTLLPGDSNRNLGTPIANSQVLILDEQLQPVDEQVMGELYIVGPGVSLGYLNQPRQTAEHFVHLPLPDGQTLRAYRSGDLAKWTKSGIELGGRRDQQVKIRGFRVEPQEVEHCLRSSQLFRQVAVVIDRDRQILAFVAQPETPDALTALKQHARQTLPDYLQPTLCTELASMPCTPNGKVDRQALLALPTQPLPTTHHGEPHTPMQVQLLNLWSELLGVPVTLLSTDESFFNLGGHSILLSRMLLRIREQFGRSLSLSRFFETPTVRTLATLMGDDAPPEAPTGQATRDALRELHLQALPEDRAGERRKVIVTGANSFLGVHIVEALLAEGALEVACLVRDHPGHSATERFAEALREYRLEHLDLSRVRVYAADISQPRLGLASEAYEYLAGAFGVLVHNAAHVNHVMDYATLAKDNVEPVLECLRLCETRCKKVFNFISTLSAASSVDAQGQVLETLAATNPPLYIQNGYNLSKWVAERLLGRAAEQGTWVNIHRPGNISFNSRSGVCEPQKNRLMLMLKGSLQLGLVPRLKLNFDLMPVDFLARFIAFHSGRCGDGGTVFNLHNPRPLSWETYVDAFRQAGHAFELVSVAHWQRHLHTVDSRNALFGVLGFYLNGVGEDIGDTSMIRHDNAQRGVEQMGTHYPEKNPALLRKGCEYLKSIGFLPPGSQLKETL